MSTHHPGKPEAYVTLVATDSYVKGAIVMAYSIRNIGTTKLLICLATPDLEEESAIQLRKVFDHVLPISKLDTLDVEKLTLLGRLELGLTVSKIHIWSLDWIETVLFLDADTLVLKSLDHLFERYRDIPFAACPDPGWPDCFNSGVFLCKPNRETYQDLLNLLATEGSFDGGDQGLLNSYFSEWSQTAGQRMPFIYNVTPNAVYSYAPAYQKNSDNIAVMHFIGKDKPWDSEPPLASAREQLVKDIDPTSGASEIRLNLKTLKDEHPLKALAKKPDTVKLDHRTYLDKWWEIYRTNIRGLTDDLAGLTLQDSVSSQSVSGVAGAPHAEGFAHNQAHADHSNSNYSPAEERSRHTPNGNHEPPHQSNNRQKTYSDDSLAAFSTRYSFDTAYTTIPTSQNEHAGSSRPFLPRNALNNLSERNMLTPAHQQANEHSKPFPLFEEYLRPRSLPSASRGPWPQPTTAAGQRYHFPSSSFHQKAPPGYLNPPIQVFNGHAVPLSSKGRETWKSIPIELITDTDDSLDEDSALLDIEKALSDSLKVQVGVPWEAKLTCTSSKPRLTTSGEFQTTYTLLWNENTISNSSVPATSSASQRRGDPHPADYMPLRNSPRVSSPASEPPAPAEKPQDARKPNPALLSPAVNGNPSGKSGFGKYRVRWDQPELQGWTVPALQRSPATYQDTEVSYKRR